MRIKGLYVDGFGLFHNLRVEGLPPGLTILLGRNESGKSTLLGFLRTILFGFPDGRSSENPYPPLRGGRHGGNVLIETADQETYVAERYAGPLGGKVDVLKPDHGRGDKAFLDRLLGMVDRSLFRNVYGFSLAELQHFETLNTESLKETLFSAGAGLNPGGLARFKADLEKREGQLFKASGSKPVINTIVSRLTAVVKEKRALSGSVEQYDLLQSRIAGLDEQNRVLMERRMELSRRLKKTEYRIRLWPDWVHLLLVRKRLQELEVIEDFPEGGVSRYEGMRVRLEDAQEELAQKQEDLQRQETALSELKPDPAVLSQAASIRRLRRDQSRFEAVIQEAVALREELAGRERKLKEGLSRLGPSWDEEKILAFDISIAVREEVRRYREGLKEGEMEVKGKREFLEQLHSNERDAENALRRMPGAGVKDRGDLERMMGSCRELRDILPSRGALETELANLKENLEDLEREKGILEETLRPGLLFPVWPIPVVLGAGLLLAVWSGINRSWPDAAPVIGVALLVGLGLWIHRSKMGKREWERSLQGKERLSVLAGRLGSLKRREEEVQPAIQEIEELAAAAARTLSLSEAPTADSLKGLEGELEEEMKTLELRKRAGEDPEEARRRVREGAAEVARAEAGVEEIRRTWKAWLKDRGLDPALSPEGALEALSVIETGREQAGALRQLRARLKSLEEAKTGYIRVAADVMSSLKGEAVEEGVVPAAVQGLINEFSEAEQASQKLPLLLKEVEASRRAVERIRKQILGLEGEIDALIAAGGAEEGEGFRRRGAIYEKRLALKKEKERTEENLKRQADAPEDMTKIEQDLSKMSLEALEEERRSMAGQLEEVEATLDTVKRDQARLEEQARQLTNDERISALRVEEQRLREALSYHAREWSVVRLAQGLIRKARERYEREMQPEVIGKAERFFERLTLGRYPSLAAPVGENRIEVVCRDNSRKGIGELSRGTAEQLYLSIRFGFIQEFSKRTEPLPIIMDEVLVNFDPPRSRAAAQAVLEISREHQVLFFTCRPETAALFRDLDPQLPVLEITEEGALIMNQRKAD